MNQKTDTEALEALLLARKEHASTASLARAMDKPVTTIKSRLKKAHLTLSDFPKPDIIPVDISLDLFNVKGLSTLYDARSGEAKVIWVKANADAERQKQAVQAIIESFIHDIKPAKPTKPPKIKNDDLLSAYLIGDAHVGLYAWGEETGDDSDLSIVESDLLGAIDRLVESSPPAAKALIAQLGDFFHLDNTSNQTPRGGNVLDVDTRFRKVVRVGIRIMRYTIDRCLEKHQIVHLRNVEGNHDPVASVLLSEAMKGYYVNEPRVIIEDSPKLFFTFRFGSCLIGITHGDKAKIKKLPGMLAVDAQKDWGECDFKYVWHGHYHCDSRFEDMGVVVEGFRTLAAPDSWNISMGYRSGREAQVRILHKDFGLLDTHTAGIRMVRS